ncbi:alpha/beta fold hydrolase [Undibacterium sp. TJN25]|uniref:alpha/beta fold hydrolase n=1 Tax=Undibacterium sp. TJN25 TaxID=3413056 RepID=UPI003BF2A464
MDITQYRKVDVDGFGIFYREAGPADAPVLLLLHGFPSAGHMFRDLIPTLSHRYHVIAPDLPGFGQSDMPSETEFEYTFRNLAKVIGRFAEIIGLDQFALYVFDYGAPVGLRVAVNHPERITAIISQNGNAYEDGLSAGWNSMKEYWRTPTREVRDSFRSAFTIDSTRYQYLQGVTDPSTVSPDGIVMDDYYLARPGAHEVQLAFFLDYGTNVSMYPEFQRYLRTYQPPLLAVWGKNDPYFLPAGAIAFKTDIPSAEIHLFDTGHFALETHASQIGEIIDDFLLRELRVSTAKKSSTTQFV